MTHPLILGMTGSGKSYFCNFLLQNAQKYQPLTFIFDVGGSYLNVGHESRDFTINPFSLPSTKENRQFLFSFFRVPVNFFLCARFPFREIPRHKATMARYQATARTRTPQRTQNLGGIATLAFPPRRQHAAHE